MNVKLDYFPNIKRCIWGSDGWWYGSVAILNSRSYENTKKILIRADT